MLRKIAIAAATAAAVVAQVVPAAACGGLVAPNGAIRLSRATTFVDWRDGVERYFTSFAYQGSGFDHFGWIVPLPAVPSSVEEGGGWTLQRLNRETHPQVLFDRAFAAPELAPAAGGAEVLLTTTVRALDITVLRGSGPAIADWCRKNGFLLTPETADHLAVYAHGSPIFMAAKYDVKRAQATNQVNGDGAPVLITMPLAHPWIPLEVLANGSDQVGADIYVITPHPVYVSDMGQILNEAAYGTTVPDAPGLAVVLQRPVSDQLFRDLSSDKNMGWMRPGGWLTYITLDAPARLVTFDMGISDTGVIHIAPFGTTPMKVASYTRPLPAGPAPSGDSPDAWLWGLLAALVLLGVGLLRLRRTASA